MLGISQRRLRVVVPDVGASFGLKTYVESETVCVAWAAMRLRRPVRWIQDRYESLVCDATCRDYECKIIGYADARGPRARSRLRRHGRFRRLFAVAVARRNRRRPRARQHAGLLRHPGLSRPCHQRRQQQARRPAVPRRGAAAVVHRPRDRHGRYRAGSRHRSARGAAAQFRQARADALRVDHQEDARQRRLCRGAQARRRADRSSGGARASEDSASRTAG